MVIRPEAPKKSIHQTSNILLVENIMQVESIAEQLFFTTVRIDTVATNGAQGSGTGFFFSHKVGDKTYPFIVTNKHVVKDTHTGCFTFLKRENNKPLLGNGFKLEIKQWKETWFGHPTLDVDIAICPFVPVEAHIKQQNNFDIFYKFIDSGMIPTQEIFAKLDAIETITFVGYPNGIWDKSNLLPIARRGTTATPLTVDFENSPRFLIDASVFGGSSGSPVFILNQGTFTERSGNTIVGSSRLLFVGVIAGVFYRIGLNEIIESPIPTQNRQMTMQQEMIDLGVVFKASAVVETVEAFLKTMK